MAERTTISHIDVTACVHRDGIWAEQRSLRNDRGIHAAVEAKLENCIAAHHEQAISVNHDAAWRRNRKLLKNGAGRALKDKQSVVERGSREDAIRCDGQT